MATAPVKKPTNTTPFTGMTLDQSNKLIADSQKELAELEKARQTAAQTSTVNFNGTSTAPIKAPTITAPTFNADAYYNKGATGLTDVASKQKELTLAQLRASRDKAVGDINLLKKDVTPAYQQKRDETDFQSKLAANRLREMMAAQGLGNSGKNVTEEMRLNAANINSLNDLNLQERRTLDDYDKQIRDIMDPSQEQNIIGQADLELMRQLNDLRMRADDRAYDNDWRTADFTRQGQWHDDEVAFRDKDWARQGLWRTEDEADEDRAYNRGVFESDRGYKRGVYEYGLEDHRADDNIAYERAVTASQITGKVTPELAKFTGLKAGTPMTPMSVSSGGGSRGGGGGGYRSSGYSGSGSSSSGGFINLNKTYASGNKYFDSLPGDKFNSSGQKTYNGVGAATKAALKNEFRKALSLYSGKDGYQQFQKDKALIRERQPDTADYLINAIENAFAYAKK